MAKILVIDPALYLNSQVQLRRGDRWTLGMRVVERIGGVDSPVDLTGAAASAFFEADDGSAGLVQGAVDLDAGKDGRMTVTVAEAVTPTIAESPEGVSLYATVDHPTLGLITVSTTDEPLAVADRSFTQF